MNLKICQFQIIIIIEIFDPLSCFHFISVINNRTSAVNKVVKILFMNAIYNIALTSPRKHHDKN